MHCFKAVRHIPFGDLQSLPVPPHCQGELFIDFVTGLLVSIYWKSEIYDSILVIIDRLTKIVNYKPIKVRIVAASLTEVIINIVVRHHGLADIIVSNQGSVFTSKVWSLLCYFPDIKQILSTAFHPETDR